MYQTRHTGPPNNPQAPPPNQTQFSGPLAVINESCDRIQKEFDALQAANHSLRMEIEKLHNEKQEVHKHFIMYYEMSYGLHLDVCKQKEIAKRLNNIILNILPFLSNDQQAQIAGSVDRAKQVSPEELNSIVDQQMRDGYAAAEMHPAMGVAGLPGLGRPLPGTPGMPGLHGLPQHGPPLHLPHNMPPHTLPPHAPPLNAPPLHGLPPQALIQSGLNMSSPPNTAGLLAMSGAPSSMPGGCGGGVGGLVSAPPNIPPPNKKQNSSKKHRRNEDSPHTHTQHPVMLNNSSSVSDDEKSEDLVVDGNDDRISSPNSHHNGSNSPRENGSSMDWNQRSLKKERPLSRASSANSGPSGRERASPKTTASHKAKSSPNPLAATMPDLMGPPGPAMPGGLPPGLAGAYGPVFPIGSLGPDSMSMPLGPGGIKMSFGPAQESYSCQLDHDGQPKLVSCSPRALADPSVPKKAREVFSLNHGEVVCAVALSNPTRNIYTGGKGFVKVWSLDNSESNNEVRAMKVINNPVVELPCLPQDAYVRSCKLLPDGKKLIVGGEVPPISVWDLGNGGATKIGELKELATACYALAISPDSKTCITCFSDGTIGIYDVHNLQLIGKFQGHEDGASCIDISSDGNTLWTGGLDTTLKSWNLNSNKIVGEKDYVTKTRFDSQIFSIGCCPGSDYIAVGMENSIVEVMNTNNKHEKMQLKMHDSCVLALKYSASGKWFISTGKDKLLNLCGSPAINCPLIMKFQENSSVLSCDISSDDKYFATGSGDKKATVYEVLY